MGSNLDNVKGGIKAQWAQNLDYDSMSQLVKGHSGFNTWTVSQEEKEHSGLNAWTVSHEEKKHSGLHTCMDHVTRGKRAQWAQHLGTMSHEVKEHSGLNAWTV